jgi:hypothetical protein
MQLSAMTSVIIILEWCLLVGMPGDQESTSRRGGQDRGLLHCSEKTIFLHRFLSGVAALSVHQECGLD